ncbi:ABC transporter ATP-binding protein [Desulfopila sp. IMCC35006]|uniref:ABC transporter ATP-binding protein n=1 Tax=Desulfopila sp. IMCC35006 TaxID=2569542 RepID=UPI0010ACD6D4|nr:ABC transporter ATP-binding protein [Desulfopila sp. IMCC35006]TKB24304.1 ABC transporter ATP-binding protein [Desulfopila sp. IMCC35006]
MPLLEIKNLSVTFKTAGGEFTAVDRVSLNIAPGEIVSIVGESGSGKSVSMLALMGLLPWTATITADTLRFNGQDLKTISKKQLRQIIGSQMAMIFQEPMTSLNPCFTIGFQLTEALKIHLGMNRAERKKRAIELLDLVGIPEPQKRLAAFPHQLSGGMNQRVMIAMSISCNPLLLIADEPTTALDVTIQAQILDLLLKLQKEQNMSLVLITHDMGVVAETAERVAVQYAGQQVEKQLIKGLFSDPHHPYTQALLNSLPERSTSRILPSIAGVVPGQFDKPVGCLFSPRCQYATELCRSTPPVEASPAFGRALCHYPLAGGLPTNYPEEVSA